MEYGAHNYHEYPSPSPSQILKHHLLDGTIVLAPTPPNISVALCVPKKHSNEEQVIGEDQIQGEYTKWIAQYFSKGKRVMDNRVTHKRRPRMNAVFETSEI
jgi:hypothetical protein